MIKILLITSIIIYLCVILTTSSPFQANNLFQDRVNTSVNHNIQPVYAQKNNDDDDDDDDNGKDDDDDDDNSKDDDDDENGDKSSLIEGNIPITNIANSQDESLLSFSPSVGNSSTSSLLQPENPLVGNYKTLQ